MNEKLANFARDELKEMLSRCTQGQVEKFKQMYSYKNRELDIGAVVDNMPSEKLDWAMDQCQRTLDNNG